ncbi:phosphoribosyl transferase [Candidatus Shapirobacteria bacterium CG10_big_fil_rev_8_21_14_0_10_40_9]|uniref:Phosphoribosyl transferase n=1 Tax=Candidatus Shapirobacteria bacterium CG10_big_fil_rev_8_21_14_0_10_40_9 TaxID=1974888 RepID=A0A2M8L3L9_9BACT|nr:MAG: phosphoribosyl transferase [Candidatus Shapirobacteria bacterium CG10_big_fil_rev_8_21_14_0_10_40_9]
MFKNREEAGRKLADKLLSYKATKNLIVLAIPRGGVVVGKILSQALNCPLDVLITRKIGAPGNPELAVGAVGPGGIRIIDWELAKRVGADGEYLKAQSSKLQSEIQEREKKFRARKKPLEVTGKTVILTDDGIATGATIEAAIAWLKSQKAKKIILAVPVAPPEVVEKLRPLVDELICLDQPEFFAAVGQFYQEFEQVTDDKVVQLLASRD